MKRWSVVRGWSIPSKCLSFDAYPPASRPLSEWEGKHLIASSAMNFWVLIGRTAVNGILLLGAVWLSVELVSQAGFVAAVGVAVAVLIYLLRWRFGSSVNWLAALETAADLGLVTVWLWTLRSSSDFFWLYYLPCGLAAILAGRTFAVLSCLLSAGLYMGLAAYETHGISQLEPIHWIQSGALLGVGLLFVTPPQQSPETRPQTEDVMDRVTQTLEDLESSQRELRSSYRELAYHYRRLQDALRGAQDSLEVLATIEHLHDPEFHQALIEHLSSRLGASGAALWLVDETGLQLRVRVACGVLSRFHDRLQATSNRQVRWMARVATRITGYLRSLPPEALAQAYAGDKRTKGWEDRAEGIEGADSFPPSRSPALSSLSVPLRSPERYYGVLSLVTGHPNGFETGTEDRLRAIAPHITALVVIQEQIAGLQSRLQELQVLHELDQILFTTVSRQGVAYRVLQVIQPVLRFEHAMLYLFDESQGANPAAVWGEPLDLISGLEFESGRGLRGWIAGGHKPILIEDTTLDPRTANITPKMSGAGSIILVCLTSGNKVRGAIILAHPVPHTLTKKELEMAQIIASHLSLVLERARLLNQLELLAITDGLTGLYNYRHFQNRLQDEIRRAKRYKIPFSILLIDLDEFKRVNDDFGHMEGDHVLIRLAELIRMTLRETEIIARYGGDEFVVLMAATPLQAAKVAAERVRQAVEDYEIPGIDTENAHRLTVSIGVAGFPESSENPVHIVEIADQALEKSKHSGRNHVHTVENPV
jgi:diguanylate cyclase (GGDEF)-like protein